MRVVLLLLASFGLLLPLSAGAAAARQVPGCGSKVTTEGGTIFVAPSGGEDTENLQCALDAAIRAGPTTVQLSTGTFHTAQLVAKGFVGHLRGSGRDSTIVTNVARPVYVTPVDMYLVGEPSATNPYPSLVAFVGGNFRVSDLSVRVTGEAPTTGWSILGIAPPIKAFAHVFLVVGQQADAAFENLLVEGAPAPSDLFGLNVANGIFFEGFLPGLPPISGTFDVRGSTFRLVGDGAPAGNVRDGEIRIIGNRFESVLLGGEAYDLENVTFTYAGNHVQADWAGFQAYDNCLGLDSLCGFTRTSLLIVGNEFTSLGDGVEILATFKPGATCGIVGNKVEYGGVAVWLGPGSGHCLVVTRGVVTNEGTGNKVITIP